MILPLLAAMVVFLMTAVSATMVQLQARQKIRRVQNRIDSVALAYLPGRAQQPGRRRKQAVSHAFRLKWESLLGYRAARRDHYSWPLRRVLVVAIVPALVGCLMLTRVFGLFAWLFVPALWILVLRYYHASLESRLCTKLYNQFPDALSMIVRAVRVGVPVTEAVRMVSVECQRPTAMEFRQLSEEVAIGVPLEQALRQMGARNRLAEYRFFATALALQSQTGGGLTETLETLADTIRKRAAARSRGHALASEARTSCYMLAGLPIVVCGGLYATNPDYISVLFTTSGGNKLLALAATSLSVGLFSMRTIIRKSLS